MGELHLGSEGYSTDGTNGRVGIGTNAPSEALTVVDTTQLSVGNGKGNAGANEIQIKAPAALLLGPDSKTSGNEFLRFATDTRNSECGIDTSCKPNQRRRLVRSKRGIEI